MSRSKGALHFHIASLYPLLYRLEARSWMQGLGVAAISLIANLIPAQRAATVDPMRILRFE